MLAPALRTVLCILLQWFHHYRCIHARHSFVLAAFPLKYDSSLPGDEETVLGQAEPGLKSRLWTEQQSVLLTYIVAPKFSSFSLIVPS